MKQLKCNSPYQPSVTYFLWNRELRKQQAYRKREILTEILIKWLPVLLINKFMNSYNVNANSNQEIIKIYYTLLK